ncbi:MAG TPA: DNA repair protein RecO [Methylocystis sp.]|nr:DNA repair protein RecO [Methylocystis sp.]
MRWRDKALVIGARRHGETSVILEVLAKARGRRLGLVRGAAGPSLRAALQPGNDVEAQWSARLDDQLGTFVVEPARMRAASLIGDALALNGLATLCALLRQLPEREPCEDIYEMAETIADRLSDRGQAPALLARFELALLRALGFGLDLSACALTGASEDLAYVSPRSGRAVSRSAGAPWRERLLPFPAFLQDDDFARRPADAELADAFRLSGHFLDRDVFAPRGAPMPLARGLFLKALAEPPA